MRKNFATCQRLPMHARRVNQRTRKGCRAPTHVRVAGRAGWLALILVALAVQGLAQSTAEAEREPAGPEAGGTTSWAEDGPIGDWYVLVHYRDRVADDPQRMHWRDEIWRFEPSGQGLLWTVHPVVELRDQTARYEELGDERRARTLGAWAPSERQLEEIRRGLQIYGEGARAKKLRGTPAEGYRSAGSLHSVSSSTIGYHESWRIAAPLARPVFSRTDEMGSGRTTGLSGVTRFTTRSVAADGLELRGEYERDGELHGDFRMLRMGIRVGSGRPVAR
jgi:hypothetical protein